jgi:hypothetical protein
MLEAFRTTSGEPAFSYNGRLLCSKVAPYKEAQSFIEKHKDQLATSESVFLLGLGSGHVVERLRATYPFLKIVVVEVDTALIEGVSNCFAFSLMNIDIVHAADVSTLKGRHEVIKALAGVYTVLRQTSSQWLNADLYNAAEELLTGRSPDAFTYLLSVREDVREALRPLVEVGGPATIKTLNSNLDPAAGGERSKIKLLIKALRELVI